MKVAWRVVVCPLDIWSCGSCGSHSVFGSPDSFAPIAPQQPNEQSSSISRMADINVVSHYANPSFNAEKEALDYFSRETVDLYRGYSHQLEQLKVWNEWDVVIFIVWNGDFVKGKRFWPLQWVHRIFEGNSEDGRLYGAVKKKSEPNIHGAG